MTTQLIINLPVNSLGAAQEFYTALGFKYNEEMSDEVASCFNVNEHIVIALLPIEEFKRTIGGNKVADATTNETLLAMAVDSRQAVDDFADKAIAAGGKELYDPTDLPGIYGRAIKDLDNHLLNAYYTSK
jgi:predicted lactoylglutathione lyase